MFSEISQNWQENTFVRLSLLIKAARNQRLLWMFSSEFCQIFKNIFSTEHLQATASVQSVIDLYNFLSFWCVLLLKICYLFHFNRKWNKKGKYPDGVQISTFFSSIDLFDVKDFKRNLTDGNLVRKSVLRRI